MTSLVRDLILSAGKLIVFLGSLITLLLAIGYMFFPELLKSVSVQADKVLETKGWPGVNKQIVGIIFLVVSVVLFLMLALIR